MEPDVPAQDPSVVGLPLFWLAGADETASLVAEGAALALEETGAEAALLQPNLTLLSSHAVFEENPDQTIPLTAFGLAVRGNEPRDRVMVCVSPVRPVTGSVAEP